MRDKPLEIVEPVRVDDEISFKLPEHEVLLSFANDSGAELFHEWWYKKGEKEFQGFCKNISER